MKKPCAYCVLREARHGAGRWMESGFASVSADGTGLRVYLQMFPVSGFDGVERPVKGRAVDV